MYLWPAVDSEGEVLDMLVQSRRKGCSHAADAQAAEEPAYAPIALIADRLRGGGPGVRPQHRPHSGQAQEQSRRKLARPDPTARAEDAGLPVSRLGPTLPFCPRRCRQYLHYLPSPNLRRYAQTISVRSLRRVARGCGARRVVRRTEKLNSDEIRQLGEPLAALQGTVTQEPDRVSRGVAGRGGYASSGTRRPGIAAACRRLSRDSLASEC
jgi:hypothetical protein